MAVASKAAAKRPTLGSLLKAARGKQRAHDVAVANNTTVDVLRQLEGGQRPVSDVARRLIRYYRMDARPIAAELADALSHSLAGMAAEDQVVALDSFVHATARFRRTGKLPRVRVQVGRQPALSLDQMTDDGSGPGSSGDQSDRLLSGRSRVRIAAGVKPPTGDQTAVSGPKVLDGFMALLRARDMKPRHSLDALAAG